MTTLIRACTTADLPSVAAIYGHHVLHGTGTFELDPPSLDEMTTRFEAVTGQGLPWLVAQHGNDVLGYAYATHFRARPAYRFTLEDSVYIAPRAQGGGLGKALLTQLISHCEALGTKQLLAVIGDSENRGSVGLHTALGFEHSGVLKAVGWKFERWLDVVLMQRALGT